MGGVCACAGHTGGTWTGGKGGRGAGGCCDKLDIDCVEIRSVLAQCCQSKLHHACLAVQVTMGHMPMVHLIGHCMLREPLR